MKPKLVLTVIIASLAALDLAVGAVGPLPSITVHVLPMTAAEAAQANASNALYTASLARLSNRIPRGPRAPIVSVDPSTNAGGPVTITLLAGERPPHPPHPPHPLSSGQTTTTDGMSPMTLSVGCVEPPSGLVSWWQAEGDSGDAMDNNPGALVNDASFSWGLVGQAFVFDASASQSVEIPNSTPSGLITPAFTWEMWVLPTQTIDWQSFIYGQCGGSQLVLQGADEENVAVGFYLVGDGNWHWLGAANTIPINQWTHLAVSWDGNSMKLYINGDLNAEGMPGVSQLADSGCSFSVGGINDDSCGYYGQYFSGLVDELSVYNRALLDGEIYAIYQAGGAGKCRPSPPPPPPPTCVAYPASAAAWWAAEGDASDVLGFHNGTPQNWPGFVAGKVGQAFNFTGNNSVRVTNVGLIWPSWSIEAWVNPTAQVNWQAFLLGQCYGRQMILRQGSSGPKPALAVSTDPYNWQVLEGDEIQIGQWTHVVGVCDSTSGTLSLYINGGLRRWAVLGITPWNANCDWTAGGINSVCGYTGQYFNGGVDELTLYRSALTGSDVAALYNAGSQGKCRLQNALDAWLQYYFGANFLTDPNAALNADPDHDGLNNLMEYNQGRNPTVTGTLPDNGTLNLQVYTLFK